MGISFNAASLLNGNSIDVNAVVSEIQSAQSGQLTAWKGDVTNLQTQATALTSINTDLSNLASAVAGLSNGALTAVTASSSESAIVTATAQTGATAANYTVVVSVLATTGTLYTASLANANTSILPTGQTTGDLNLQIGGAGGTAADIPITAGSNDTLTKLAASIDSLSATNKWGITASVVTDASGARLAIYSQSTGSAGALATNTNTTNLTFEPPVGGTNAVITINGIPYASTTNTVTGAIPDVTLTLTSADSATPVEISVGPDTNQITNSINNFVTEYNTVVSDLNTQFTVNAATNQEGPVGSDSALRILQSSLLADITYATTDPTSVSSGLTNLAALGIDLNNDGTLTVNQVATDTHPSFSDVLAKNPGAVLNFFQNSDATGFADNLTTALTNLTDPSTGVLKEDLASNQSQQTDLGTEITNFQTQLAAQTTQLDQVFDTVNATLEEYPFLLDEVTQELASISSSSTTPTTSTNTAPATGESTSGSGSTSGS
ncbi:MAG TPA: flagellar filament capping protein FliD [Terriglobales bacterium]|jgi:flagellar hook-associated protein 2|nr:flagellar filament capping protein FliD [Terriglobales bacterium]